MKGFYETHEPKSFLGICEDVGCALHFHNRIEMSYIISGTHYITVNNKEYVLTENDIFFCNPFDMHQFSSRGSGKHILVSVKKEYMQRVFQDKKIPYLTHALQDKEYNKTILSVLETVLNEKGLITDIEINGYINIILGKLLKHYPLISESVPAHNTFIDIITYINKHYTEDLTRDSLAKTFCYSPNYFSHQFKKVFNMGVTEYINSIRFSKAYHDISEKKYPDMTNSKIILMHGFNNTQSYYRIYRKQNKH